MASQWPPVKNDSAGATFYVSLVSQANTKVFQASPTLAAGDVKIAIDDGAPANLATLPVVDADFTKRVKVVLGQAETNGDNISLIWSDASGAEWCDLTMNLQTVPARQTGDVYALAAGATGFAALAAFLDTEIAAIKAKTDQLTFTNATTVDASLQLAADVTAAVANKLADHLLRRNAGTAAASASGDTLTGLSLVGAVAKNTHKLDETTNAGFITVFRTDGTTEFYRQAITTDASGIPIVAIGGAA